MQHMQHNSDWNRTHPIQITPSVFDGYLYTEHGKYYVDIKNNKKVLHSFEQAIWANAYKT